MNPPTNLYKLAVFLRKYHLPESCRLLLSGIITAAFTLLCTVAISRLIADIPAINILNNTPWFILCFAAVISANLFYLNHLFLLKSLNTHVVINICSSLWEKIIHTPGDSSHLPASGELAEQIFMYEAAVSSALTINVRILSSLIPAFFLVVYMIFKFGLPAVILFLSLSVVVICRTFALPFILRHTHDWLLQQRKLSSHLNEVFSGMHKIRSTHTENMILEHWINGLLLLKQKTGYIIRAEMFTTTFDALTPALLLLALQFIYGRHADRLSPDIFLSFIFMGGQLSLLLSKIPRDITLLIPLLSSLSGIKTLTGSSLDQTTPAKPYFPVHGSITLENLTFKRNDRILLQDIQLSAHAGEFVALTGPSGSGKSTLLRLILGLETLTSGKILIDGRNITHLNIKKLRQAMGVVMQNQSLMPGSIYENLTVHTALSQAELWHLIDLVGLRSDLESMPMGLHTYLSDTSGESLSGGQRQKILLARALSTRPRILLLDEATSALDNQSQAHICNSLSELKITRIVTAHRLSTIAKADRIYEIKKGGSGFLEGTRKLCEA